MTCPAAMEETLRASARNRAVRIVSSTSISEKSLKQQADPAGRESPKMPRRQWIGFGSWEHWTTRAWRGR